MKLPVVLSWKALKGLLGHPYSRTHTWRLMQSSYEVERRRADEGLVVEVIPNTDPFPPCFKLGEHTNSPPVWLTSDVLAWYRRRGIPLTEGLDSFL
jgi:predicted DNA-binding transcriptional regulator AlpA